MHHIMLLLYECSLASLIQSRRRMSLRHVPVAVLIKQLEIRQKQRRFCFNHWTKYILDNIYIVWDSDIFFVPRS